MKSLKKIIFTFLALLLISQPALAANLGIEDRADAYLIGDFESGKVLEDYNIDEKMNMASISKLMTYLVVKDNIAAGNIALNDRVTVTEDMAAVGGSSFRLLEGEVLTVEDLLQGLMVVSGNDAAYALAVHTAGSEEAFVALMNGKAQELDLSHAEFYNASGLQAEDGQNTMTTREIFSLARHIIKTYPEILDYGQINILSMPERDFMGYSTLPLIGEMPGVDGLKTGFTEEAGYCLVSTMDASKNPKGGDFRVITIVMGTASLDERRDLSKFLLDYSLDNYQLRSLTDKDMPYTEVKVNSAKEGRVALYPETSYQLLASNDEKFSYEEEVDDSIKAPIKEGQVLGKVRISSDGEELTEVNLVSKYDIEKAGFFTRLARTIGDIFSRLLSFIG